MRARAALHGGKLQNDARGQCDMMVDWRVAVECLGWRGDGCAAGGVWMGMRRSEGEDMDASMDRWLAAKCEEPDKAFTSDGEWASCSGMRARCAHRSVAARKSAGMARKRRRH
jgi:hypothetical protein